MPKYVMGASGARETPSYPHTGEDAAHIALMLVGLVLQSHLGSDTYSTVFPDQTL